MSETAFTIRPATPGDAAALTTLRSALFSELGQSASDAVSTEFEEHAHVAFAEGLERGHCFAWLACDGGQRPIASIALLVFPRLPAPSLLASQEGYLLSVFTAPPWRKKGIAAQLLARALDKARSLGLGRVRLHSTAQGRPVYEAAGFYPRMDEMELRL